MKRNQLDKYRQVVREFEQLSRLQFEDEEFEKFVQFAVNDYIAIHKGYAETKDTDLIKTKGMFINYPQLGKGLDSLIIPKALVKYFADGVLVEDTILNCTDIHDFISYQKIDKEFHVACSNDMNISHINRFYYSTDGGFLYKYRVDDIGKPYDVTKVNAKFGVTIYNYIPKGSSLPNNINYRYYIGQCKTIINQLENVQLSLF